MNLYTVQVTLQVAAESEHEAYSFIRAALDNAKKAEVVIVDQEVTKTEPIEDEPEPDGKFHGLCDPNGPHDTWEEQREQN